MDFKKTKQYSGSESAGFDLYNVYVSGNWKIYREGRMNRYGGYDVNAGMFGVERNGESYGYFDTLKEAKSYVELWVSINPKDI